MQKIKSLQKECELYCRLTCWYEFLKLHVLRYLQMRKWELRSGSDKLKSGCGKVEKGLTLGHKEMGEVCVTPVRNDYLRIWVMNMKTQLYDRNTSKKSLLREGFVEERKVFLSHVNRKLPAVFLIECYVHLLDSLKDFYDLSRDVCDIFQRNFVGKCILSSKQSTYRWLWRRQSMGDYFYN